VQLKEPDVRSIRLEEFEQSDEPLKRAKADGRSRIEYYFTCTPSLIGYVARNNPGADFVTYLDADLMFFADPRPIYEEMGEKSVLIIPHRFPASQTKFEQYGVYNVGWVSFRQDAAANAVLSWWRERTLEWCRDYVDEANRRYGDQRYLDRFPELFAGVHVLKHAGANVAPWNLARHRIAADKGSLTSDGERLLFFHYHGLKRLSPTLFMTADGFYGVARAPFVEQAIYRPYLDALIAAEREVALMLPNEMRQALRKGSPGHVRWLPDFVGKRLAVALAWLRGRTIRVARI
jgi:hypothetical protein